ncbi:MAG: hypothetical protein ATN31_06440 [Candidatus Epulonipiscioides saccharophilum]|nr:MAG: hypothetical protein ATN31_06440 [Epulopiscium sp. AS2M-Bin001]
MKKSLIIILLICVCILLNKNQLGEVIFAKNAEYRLPLSVLEKPGDSFKAYNMDTEKVILNNNILKLTEGFILENTYLNYISYVSNPTNLLYKVYENNQYIVFSYVGDITKTYIVNKVEKTVNTPLLNDIVSRPMYISQILIRDDVLVLGGYEVRSRVYSVYYISLLDFNVVKKIRIDSESEQPSKYDFIINEELEVIKFSKLLEKMGQEESKVKQEEIEIIQYDELLYILAQTEGKFKSCLYIYDIATGSLLYAYGFFEKVIGLVF